MTFGTQNAKTACLDNLLLFGIRLCLELCIQLCIARPCLLLFLGELPVGIGEGNFYHIVVKPLFPHTLFSEVFGVTAKQNIRTTACHVGCNGYSAKPACLGNYLCFTFVVFSV